MAKPTRPAKKSSLLDRALGAIGLQRRAPARTGTRVYAGASISRLTGDWMGARASADQSMRADFRLLKERARELERDNPIVARYRELQADNVIGPDGIRLQCMVRMADGVTFDREANTKIEAAWQEWSMPEYCDVAGLQSLTEIATQLVERWRIEGEALVRMWPGTGKFGFALQTLDADLLDHEFTRAATEEFGEIRMGVERNSFGRPTYYWLWTAHPNDVTYTGGRQRIRVPASEIIHVYTVRRPGQTRGITDLAPVMLSINMLGQYVETELVAARAGAGNMFFIVPGDESEGPDPDEAPDTPLEMESAPGMGIRLNKGETIQEYKPEHPAGFFAPFILNALRWVSSGLHTAYASLTGDLSNASYSSARIGMLSERDGYKRAQNTVSLRFYRRIYLEWLKYALLTRTVDLPVSQLERLKAHRWLPRGFPWIDPMKDVQAAVMAIDNRLATRTQTCAEDGLDYEEVIAQLADEEALAAEYGVTLPAPKSSTGTQDPTKDTSDDDSNQAGSGNDANDDGSAPDDGARAHDSARAARTAPEAGRVLRLLRGRRVRVG